MSEKVLLRIKKGVLYPANKSSEESLCSNYKDKDVLYAKLTKPRNPKFHALAHALGDILRKNIPSLSHLAGAHDVLKQLQFEGEIACRRRPILVRGEWIICLEARSLSFASMDQVKFYKVFRAMCNYVSETYWPSLSAEQIEKQAELMVNA